MDQVGVAVGLDFKGPGAPDSEQVVERLRASGLRAELVDHNANVYVSSLKDCTQVGAVLMQIVIESDYTLMLEIVSPDSIDVIHVFYRDQGEDQISIPVALAIGLM